MSTDKKDSTQPDKDKAASERPVPSQAEGDRETIEQDLQREDESRAAEKK